MSDAACGCALIADNGTECDCAMQSECYVTLHVIAKQIFAKTQNIKKKLFFLFLF